MVQSSTRAIHFPRKDTYAYESPACLFAGKSCSQIARTWLPTNLRLIRFTFRAFRWPCLQRFGSLVLTGGGEEQEHDRLCSAVPRYGCSAALSHRLPDCPPKFWLATCKKHRVSTTGVNVFTKLSRYESERVQHQNRLWLIGVPWFGMVLS